MPVAHKKYINRRDAGRQLASLLSSWRGSDALIYALPRGGVPVGVVIAKVLGLPLDLLYVRKIGAPLEPELALGAVVDGGDTDVVFNDELIERLGVARPVLDLVVKRELSEIARRRREYGQFLPPLTPSGRPVIIVDDGLATGATVKAAVMALRRRGAARVIVAAPVAPPDAVEALQAAGAEVVCPLVVDRFFSVGAFYRDFHQLSDADVRAALEELNVRMPEPVGLRA